MKILIHFFFLNTVVCSSVLHHVNKAAVVTVTMQSALLSDFCKKFIDRSFSFETASIFVSSVGL